MRKGFHRLRTMAGQHCEGARVSGLGLLALRLMTPGLQAEKNEKSAVVGMISPH